MVRDLAINLRRRGHIPIVYAMLLGQPAEELRVLGISVLDSLVGIDARPDVIHGHHNIPTVAALTAFRDCPAVWTCHDSRNWYDIPPRLHRMRHYLAVDEARKDYLRKQGIAPGKVSLLHNAVDLARIPLRKDGLPRAPRKALALTKTSAQIPLLAKVCERLNIEFTAMGAGARRVVPDPEAYLAGSDIVFATGRCAIEALCAGAAVIVGDARGLAGMVTPTNYQHLRSQNFGSAAFTRPLTVEDVVREIEQYDHVHAEAISAKAREDADLNPTIDRLLELYEDAAAWRSTPYQGKEDNKGIKEFVRNWPAKEEPPKTRFEREWKQVADATRTLEQATVGSLEDPNLITSGPFRSAFRKIARGVAAKVRRDSTINFISGRSARRYLRHGWSHTEEGIGVWSDGAEAELILSLPPCRRTIRLTAEVEGFVNNNHPKLSILVFVDQKDIATWHFHHPENRKIYQLDIPGMTLEPRELRMTLAISSPLSPAELGISNDRRSLGILLRRFTLSCRN